ncbi:MAG: sugar transferase [Candidatus Saccharimonadales bacterium]
MKNNASIIYNFGLIIGDALAVTLAFSIAYILRVTISHVPISAHVTAFNYLLTVISLLPFWILIFGLLGLYNARFYDKRFAELGRLLIGSFIGVLFAISYSYVTNITIFPARLVALYGFVLAFVLVSAERTLLRGFRRRLFSYGHGINNVLLVGDNKTTQRLIDALRDTSVTGYRIVGVVGGIKHKLKHHHDSYREYDGFAEAISHLRNKPLHTIIQTELYAAQDRNDEILTYAQENHAAYRFVPGNSELFVGNIEVDLFQTIPFIAVHQTALIGWGRVVKRLSDLLLGGLFLVVASPFMVLIALGVKLDGGPVFFRQTRLSRFNTPIKVLKFRTHRTAYSGLEPEEAFRKMGRPDLLKAYRENGDRLENDPRATAVGRFLRRTSLDELPQLFNVVRGDISLVGPRALVPYELERSQQKNLILSVKSGMTGLAQISGVSDLSFEERRKLDLYYVQNWSFWSDVVIVTKTFWVVLFHKGTRG